MKEETGKKKKQCPVETTVSVLNALTGWPGILINWRIALSWSQMRSVNLHFLQAPALPGRRLRTKRLKKKKDVVWLQWCGKRDPWWEEWLLHVKQALLECSSGLDSLIRGLSIIVLWTGTDRAKGLPWENILGRCLLTSNGKFCCQMLSKELKTSGEKHDCLGPAGTDKC